MSEWLQCIACPQRFDPLEIRYTCDCGSLLEVQRDHIVDRDAFDDRLTSRATSLRLLDQRLRSDDLRHHRNRPRRARMRGTDAEGIRGSRIEHARGSD